MNSQIKYWQNIILSQKQIEPKDPQELANYKIAQFLIQRANKRAA